MKLQRPLPDPYIFGMDQMAMSVALSNGTKLGKLPTRVGEVGWFGAEHIKTMLIDCGCGDGPSCHEPIVVYVAILDQDSCAYYFSSSGKEVLCVAQTHAYYAKAAGNDLLVYLDSKQAEYMEMVTPLEVEAVHYIELFENAQGKGDAARVVAKIRRLPRLNQSYIFGRLESHMEATGRHLRRILSARIPSYLASVEAGTDVNLLIPKMKRRMVPQETIDLLIKYSTMLGEDEDMLTKDNDDLIN